LPEGDVDSVISKCVVNLSPDEPRVLAEAFRVLRQAAAWESVTSSPVPA
jgi:hypothetical protein